MTKESNIEQIGLNFEKVAKSLIYDFCGKFIEDNFCRLVSFSEDEHLGKFCLKSFGLVASEKSLTGAEQESEFLIHLKTVAGVRFRFKLFGRMGIAVKEIRLRL